MREHPADAAFMDDLDRLDRLEGHDCVACERTDGPVTRVGTVEIGLTVEPLLLCRRHLASRLEFDRYEAQDAGVNHEPHLPVFA